MFSVKHLAAAGSGKLTSSIRPSHAFTTILPSCTEETAAHLIKEKQEGKNKNLDGYFAYRAPREIKQGGDKIVIVTAVVVIG